MSADGEPIYNPEGAKGAEVDRVKQMIKDGNLIFRGHDYDNPGENELDGKEDKLIQGFGLEKVETLQQLFDSMNDPNRNHDVPMEKLDILATAVCETIIEAGRKDIVVAGSVSVEKQLPWKLSARDKQKPDAPNFAFMVAEKYRERIEAGEKRNDITSAMEFLDIVKNNEELAKDGFLAEAADKVYDDLKKIRPNVLNRREMEAYTEMLKYVSSLRGKKPMVGIDDRTKREPVLTDENENKNEGVVDDPARTALTMEIINSLGLSEEDNKELVYRLLNESTNKGLSEIRDQFNKLKRESQNINRRDKLPTGGIDDLYEYMKFIEKGSSRVDDLSRNSDYYRVLYQVQNGVHDKELIGMTFEGRELTIDDIEVFKTEIKMRMFLHELALMASKCTSIEDIVRTVSMTHEGDLDHSLDRKLVTFFLEKYCGLKKLPVCDAWDLRQKGYFNILSLREDIHQSGGDFKKHLIEQYGKDSDVVKNFDKTMADVTLRDRVGSRKMSAEKLNKSIQIKKDKDNGVDNPIYKNLFMIEKGKDQSEAEMIKEYMVWKLMDGERYTHDDALKSFELAKKLSVATFFDSRANITFASDDYSEILNAKLLRVSDGPDSNGIKMGKSKGVGAPMSIPYIDSLACHWLDLSSKKGWRSVYSSLNHNEIDFDNIDGRGDMAYHFSGVVASQVVPFQEALYEKISPKDVLAFNFLNKLFAKINKTTYDMCRAKIRPVYQFKDEGLYDEDKRVEYKVSEKMRKVYVLNLMEIIGMNSSGWTSTDLENFRNLLLSNPQIYGPDRKPGASFIPPRDVADCIKKTMVYWATANNDAERNVIKKQHTF